MLRVVKNEMEPKSTNRQIPSTLTLKVFNTSTTGRNLLNIFKQSRGKNFECYANLFDDICNWSAINVCFKALILISSNQLATEWFYQTSNEAIY